MYGSVALNCTALRVSWIECNYACVGKARDLGIRQLIQNGATWLACADADSVVSPDWLRCQILHQPTDAICGIVTLDDLSRLSVMKQKNIYRIIRIVWIITIFMAQI